MWWKIETRLEKNSCEKETPKERWDWRSREKARKEKKEVEK